MSSLYILNASPLLDCLQIVFPHSVRCLFVVFIVDFVMQTCLGSWIRRINTVKMSVLPEAICRLNATPFKILIVFSQK